MKEYYEQVNVPKAPEEPDERIDKMTGMPYDVQAGEAFIDEEDRFGFAAGGLIAIIKRLSRGVDDIVEDTRPTTRFNADDGTMENIRDFIYRETEKFVEPNSAEYSVTRVTKDNADKNTISTFISTHEKVLENKENLDKIKNHIKERI